MNEITGDLEELMTNKDNQQILSEDLGRIMISEEDLLLENKVSETNAIEELHGQRQTGTVKEKLMTSPEGNEKIIIFSNYFGYIRYKRGNCQI